MKRTVLNVVLAVILLGLIALNWLGQRNYRQPNVEFMPNMVKSIPYDTFAPNPVFPDGKTLQSPVPGTVARGIKPSPYRATTQDAVRAGLELANPFASDNSDALARGAVMYQRSCLPCHGPAGAGDGTVAKRGFPPPPALTAEHARSLKDGQLFHILTYGQGNMPAYAPQISVEDRWRIVLHVRKLQPHTATTLP